MKKPLVLKVAVIAHALRAGGGVSVGINLIQALRNVRPSYRFCLFVPDHESYKLTTLTNGALVHVFQDRGLWYRLFFETFVLPMQLGQFQADVVLNLCNTPISAAHAFQAVLIQNAYLVYPDVSIRGLTWKERIQIAMSRWLSRRRLPTVDLVFCQTETMAQRVRAQLGYLGRIELLPNIVSTSLDSVPPMAVAGLPSRDKNSFILLALARYYAHKNLDAIVDCFDSFRQHLSGVKVVLTISGGQHPGAKRLLSRINALGLESQIINVGPINQRDLSAVYNSVDAVLLPTLLESSSGTYLEAMGFGVPIITSDRDFAHCTCGAAALYFDPLSPKAMLDSILTLRSDPNIRVSLIEAGVQHLAKGQSDWNVAANRSMTVMEGMLKAKGLG